MTGRVSPGRGTDERSTHEEGNAMYGQTATTAVRIGDAEREVAANELGEHFAAGRLTHEELDERLEAAWRARSAGDLRLLFVDLPSTADAGASTPPSAGTAGVGSVGRRPHWSHRSFALRLVVLLIVVAIALPGPQWPLVVLFWAWMIFGRRHRGIGWGHGRPELQRAGR